jgi:hypothetical protein
MKKILSKSNTFYMSKQQQQSLLHEEVDTEPRIKELPTPAPATQRKARMQQQ